MTKSCRDYPGAPSCCPSCHDDAEEFWPDYPLSQIEDEKGNVIADVCCAVYEYAKERERGGTEAK